MISAPLPPLSPPPEPPSPPTGAAAAVTTAGISSGVPTVIAGFRGFVRSFDLGVLLFLFFLFFDAEDSGVAADIVRPSEVLIFKPFVRGA